MRISDWSSDVCSSDLPDGGRRGHDDMTNSPLRVGIISAAWGARAHLPAWRSLDGIEVTAICTSRPETAAKAAADFDVARAFHDFRAMAADPEIDIVDCGTRPPLRHAMVMAALGARSEEHT